MISRKELRLWKQSEILDLIQELQETIAKQNEMLSTYDTSLEDKQATAMVYANAHLKTIKKPSNNSEILYLCRKIKRYEEMLMLSPKEIKEVDEEIKGLLNCEGGQNDRH